MVLAQGEVHHKRWKIAAGFGCVGLLVALPPITQMMFAAAGILAFLACPSAILLSLRSDWEYGWKFFALAAPLNTAFYAAVGALMDYLLTQA